MKKKAIFVIQYQIMEKTARKYLEETRNYSEEDARFMEMAIRLSEDNVDSGGGPFGAVISFLNCC